MMNEAITNKLKGYDISCGSTHFYFGADEEDAMFAFLGNAIRSIGNNDRGYDERVSVRKDYYYEDEL